MLFFESEDTEVSKADRNALFASNKKQIDIHTLMLDMLHSNNCQLYVLINVEVYLKDFFWCGCCFFFYLCSHKSYQRHWTSILCTQGTLQGGCVEDHRMMFSRHLHLPQLYMQAILYIYKTDYMISLTLNTLTSVCICSMLFSLHLLMCWQGEYV